MGSVFVAHKWQEDINTRARRAVAEIADEISEYFLNGFCNSPSLKLEVGKSYISESGDIWTVKMKVVTDGGYPFLARSRDWLGWFTEDGRPEGPEDRCSRLIRQVSTLECCDSCCTDCDCDNDCEDDATLKLEVGTWYVDENDWEWKVVFEDEPAKHADTDFRYLAVCPSETETAWFSTDGWRADEPVNLIKELK